MTGYEDVVGNVHSDDYDAPRIPDPSYPQAVYVVPAAPIPAARAIGFGETGLTYGGRWPGSVSTGALAQGCTPTTENYRRGRNA